jgi:hypothetical protein
VACPHRAIQRVLGSGWSEHRQQRLVERDVDDLTAARDLIAMAERGQDSGRAGQGRDHVGHRKRWKRRRPVGGAGRSREAAHGLDHRSESGPIAIRTVLSPAGDAGEDEAGIFRGQDVPAEAPFFERAGHVILDQDVGVTTEAPEQRLSAAVREVQRDRALAACIHLPPQLTAIAEPGAQGIAAARVLDLDDVRAVVGQGRREDAPGDQARAVDDPKTRERAAHFWGEVLKWRASASIILASASFSVCPVAWTFQATATATHSPISFLCTSTSNCMTATLPQKKGARTALVALAGCSRVAG